MEVLSAVFPWLIGAAMAATLLSLATGVIAMMRGNDFNGRNSNRLMRWRVGFQALTVILIVVYFLFLRGGR